jgi:hypothetical protein
MGISANFEGLSLLSPLYQRGARGDFCNQLFGNGLMDRLRHSITFFQNFATARAQHLQPKSDHVPITTSVFQGVLASKVLWAIHFDDKSCPWGEEVHSVLTDGFLPIELDAKRLFIPQARPKNCFTVCQIPPPSKSPLPPFFKGGT